MVVALVVALTANGLPEGEEFVESVTEHENILLVAQRQEWFWRVRSSFWSTSEEFMGSDAGSGWILLIAERQAWFW